jgi:hypothetical protein
MPTIIDSLLVSLGFKIDAESLEGFAKVAGDAKKVALGIVGAMTGAVYGLEHMVKGVAESMGDVQDFSERVDMSAREVAAFGAVAAANDSSLEAMEGTITRLNTLVGQAAAGFPRATMVLQRFGLHAKDSHGKLKTFDEIFGDVVAKMQNASTGKRLALAEALGIDPKLIPLLKEGVGNFKKLKDAALKENPFADQDYENAEKTDKAFQKAERSVTRLKNRIAVGLLPVVNSVLQKFIAWTSNPENIEKVERAVGKVVDVAGLLWGHLDKLVGIWLVLKAHAIGLTVLGWAASMTKFVLALRSADSVTSLLGASLGRLKALIVGGLLAAIGLLIEDLWTYYRGGTSVTGWMLEQFPYAVDAMLGGIGLLSAAFLALSASSGPLGLFVVGVTGIAIGAKEIIDAWNPLKQWFGELWDDLLNKAKEFYNFVSGPLRSVGDFFGMTLAPKLDTKEAKGGGAYAGLDSAVAWQRQNLAFNNRTNKGIGPTDYAGDVRTWGGGPVSITENHTHGPTTLQVNGAKDPAATAKEVGRVLDARDQRARERTRDAQSGHR